MYNVSVFVFCFLIPRTCRSWAAEVSVWGIYQHTAATRNRSHGDEWGFSDGMGFISWVEEYISLPHCTQVPYRDVISDQCVVFCVISHHAHHILNWCSFFLIAASFLSICGCWCSSGTWLSSLQTHVQEKSSRGTAWYVKDSFVASTNCN